MSFGGKDNRDGKRKYQWNSHNNGSKRFHGPSNSPREQFLKDAGPRWDRGPKPNEQGFSKSHRSSGNSWGRERYSLNRFPHPTNNRNYNQIFDFQPPMSSCPPKESEEVIGPGSDLERMEKVLATKRRIEEALASKSSSSSNNEINFQNSSTSSGDRSKDKGTHGPNLDLSLTNSDFKEIGSVASATSIERDQEPTDLVINSSTMCTSQQRSFDSTQLNLPTNAQTPQPRTQKVGGWSMSAVNNIVPETNQTCSPRQRSDMYFQEQREQILGNVSAVSQENNLVDVPSVPSKPSNDNKNNQDAFSRVGRLYQSFLRSRLFGYTLSVRDKSQKLTGPNPLLDKSVLENKTLDEPVIEEQVIELQMPQPIRVKLENLDRNIDTPERIEAEEASEFCKEFSFLLKDPNFLIPPDDLEKLGLGHLRELNKLIIDRRSGETSQLPVQNQDGYTTQNFGALNSTTRTDMGVHINEGASPFRNSLDNVLRDGLDRCNERDSLSNNGIPHYIGSPLGSQNTPALDQTMRPDILRNENIIFSQNPQVPAFQSVSVEAVVEKVVKTMLQPSSISTPLNSSNPTIPEIHKNSTAIASENNIPAEPGTSSSSIRSVPLNQMQDVSSKILRLFLIDKQVEELMSEKMKIYSELLSSQGVSQTLFHSWAQDQIQQGNVMNIVSNTSNAIPELNRVINHNVQEIYPPHVSNISCNNTVEEAISELYSLKKELLNSQINPPQAQETTSCNPNTSSSDSCFQPPKDVESPKDVQPPENRPKLSVRKDLLDPNRSNINLLAPPVKISTSTENNANASTNLNSMDAEKTKKKNKKTKKKDSVEVINLIEDTDDEISSVATSVATDETTPKGLNSEDEVDKKDNQTTNSRVAYDLDGKTATCLTIMKLKKSLVRVLVAGCKDGFIMGYALSEPAISFTKKIHTDTITSIFYKHKYLITGSLDSTICLFSLKEQVETQTLSTNAPVQSMDINFKQLVVGTKAGSIYSYEIKVEAQTVNEKKKMFVSLHPHKKPLSITNSSILAVKLAKEGVRKVLIVASRGEQITVRDSTSGLLLRTFDWCDTVFCLQLFEETPLVFCGTNTKSVKVVNYTDGESAGDCMIGRSITQITFCQSVLFAASHDGNIYVYDIENKSLLATVIISKGIIQCLEIDGKSHLILVASSRGDLQQIPFPASVSKHIRRVKCEKKKNQIMNTLQP